MRRKSILISAAAILVVFGQSGSIWAGWSTPVPLSEVNTAYSDANPFLSFDGLTLYFTRMDTDTFYYTRIFQATRPLPSGPFTSVQNISELNYSGGHVSTPWISQDNLRMYYYRTEPGSIWRMKVSERASTSDPWPTGVNISELNAVGNIYAPSLTEDELTIFFATYGGRDIWTANRADRYSAFGNIKDLTEINTTAWEGSPFISSDGLTLHFSSNRNGPSQIFKATRNSLSEPFGNVEHLSLFDRPGGGSGSPCPSYDGTAFYYGSSLTGVPGDIYVSYLTEPRTLIGLEIVGPNEVAENFTAGYRAIAHYEDDSTRNVTDSALWAVEPNMYASIESGVLTTKDIVYDQSTTILVDYTEGDITVAAEKTIDILAICPTGTALSFDGVDDYVEAPKLTNLNENYLTMSAWVYPSSPATDTYSTIIFSGDSTSGNDIHLALTENLELLCRADGGSTDGIFFTSENTIQLNKWQHIACVFNNTANKAYAYVNGETVLDATYLTHIPIDFLWYTQIGRMRGPDPRHNKWYFDGSIDEVRIYNRALSAEEIWANMHRRLSGDEPGLVGYWDFDEGWGQIVYDLSGNNNHGQLGSTPDVDGSDPAWIESDAPIGRCTPYLIATGSIKEALKQKKASLEKLEAALAEEWTAYEALEELLETGDYGDLKKGDIISAKQRIHSAIQHQEQTINTLEKSINQLEDALIELGYEIESLSP